MKNALIATIALAGLFTRPTAGNCEAGVNYCGKIVFNLTGYELVIQQWYYDTNKKQPAKNYENNLYSCLANGAIEFKTFCKDGCVATPEHEDDECLLKGSGLLPEAAEHECAEKPILLVAKELRV